MTKHFIRDLENLRRKLLLNGNAAEAAVERAINALMERQVALAREVIEGDALIDEREVEIEQDCLKTIALHQPVAQDLRFLVAVMKVNSDLERIGDLAKNVAEGVSVLAGHEDLRIPAAIREMSDRTRAMVRLCLESLSEGSVEGARRVLDADDAVDDLLETISRDLQGRMQQDASTVEVHLALIIVARDLERIADMATNIAEDTIFMLEGDLVRHAYRHENGSDPS